MPLFYLSHLSHFLPKAFILIIVFLISSCEMHSIEAEKETAIRFGLSAAPLTLDPRFARDATSSHINRLLYRALIHFDDQARPAPDLATWEKLTTTHYRLTLGKEGRIFHTGALLTTKDVKATYDFILDSDNASPHYGSLKNIQSIDIQDDNVIDFIIKQPDPLFLTKLTVGIVPAISIENEHPLHKEPVGSGIFKFISWTDPYTLHVLRQTDQQVFHFLTIKDPVVRVLKLLRGELDILQNGISPELVAWLHQRDTLKILTHHGTNFTYLGFNLQDTEPTHQLAIRQAIAYAINRDEILYYIFAGSARPASSLLPPTHWAGHPDLPTYDYQPTKAKILLKQVGFSRENPLKLSYKTSTDPFRVRLATILQQQLAKVGVQVEVMSYDWGTFFADIKQGRFQMYSLSWVGIRSPDIFNYVFHSAAIPPQGANRGRFSHPEVDQLLDQAVIETDLDKQAVYYQKVQEIIFAELPYIPLWYEDHRAIMNKNIDGYRLSVNGNYDGLFHVYRQ